MRMRFRMADGRSSPGDPSAVHADDGAFVIDDVPAGKWDVQASAGGYQKGRAAGVTVDEGGTAEGVEVRLVRGSSIAGRVIEDRSGKPVIDAAVRAEPASGGVGMPRMVGLDDDSSATTDAEGRFRLEGLGPGSYTLTASHPEWTEETERVELKEQPSTVEIRLGRGGAISGVVLAGGRGVGGAGVSLSAAGQSRGPFGGGDRNAITDDAGRFRFDTLTAGRYTVVASLRTQSSAPAEAVLQGDASQDVTLVLAEGATIHGVVSGLAESARGNVMVSANGPEEYFANTRTGGDGSFELTGVPKGPISLRANAGDFASGTRSATAQVVIAEGQTEAAAEIVFETGFRVDGQVTRGGRAVTDAMVTAVPEGGAGRMSSARTDDAGSYAMEGLQEGTYTFMASSMGGGGGAIRKTAKVTGDMTLDLEAPPAKIAGQVVEADSGRPLGEAMVRVEQGGGGGGGPFAVMAAESDSAGRFALESMEPRSYRVSVTRASYQTETRDIVASEDSDVTIALKRGEGVGLVVRDGIFATPLRGSFVRAVDGGGATVFMGSVTLDSEGRGEIPSLRPGRYDLRIGADGYAGTTLRAVTVPAPPLSVALTPGGMLEIQSGPQTLAMSNPSGRLLDSTGAVYYTSPFSPDGVVRIRGANQRFDHVAPGRYTFALEGGARRDVDVREGGAAVVVLP
jgi:protocatechuate 3,4-dioxygenase beta subunit